MIRSPNSILLLTATFIVLAFLLPAASSNQFLSSPVQASRPPQTMIDFPICYMQTIDNQLVNLSSLCEPRPGTLTLQSLTYNSNLVLGRVENQSKQTAYRIRVRYQVVGEDNRLLEENVVEVIPTNLAPGQIATFETVLPARSRLINTQVLWSDR